MIPISHEKAGNHTFHIPVMGLGFSIDTPLKVARFGISSVVSIMEHHLIERMREFHCSQNRLPYAFISEKEDDYKAKRITAYLNMMNHLIGFQMDQLRNESFGGNGELEKYFEMLPDHSPLKLLYKRMQEAEDCEKKLLLRKALKEMMIPGSIDVNIMTKVDRTNFSADGKDLGPEYSDASSALRGFANSSLQSSIVFSAGMNPRLFSYCSTFDCFFPDREGQLNKKIILKVSDFRSAAIQGKFLAKKGLWISEFRIESGLNCGGHAFATDGLLLGPILEDFKSRRGELFNELYTICSSALKESGKPGFIQLPAMDITAQGGLGTSGEHDFLLEYYHLTRVGWGSPFLLVPEATNVDTETLEKLSRAKKEDFYLSNSSPLGVPFNNFRSSSSEEQRQARIAKGRPGSPCYKKFLAFDTEFGPAPLCTASRQYQALKIKQVRANTTDDALYEQEVKKIAEKDCLCEGLGVTALLKNELSPSHKLKAVTICPGPNLAYFSGIFKMNEMVDHIYGRKNLLNGNLRSHMFINELLLNIDYLKSEYIKYAKVLNAKKTAQLTTFRDNLLKGIEYYKSLMLAIKFPEANSAGQFLSKLSEAGNTLTNMNSTMELNLIK